MSLPYQPGNWYWSNGDGSAFSSASLSTVQATDPTYQSWLAAGGIPTASPGMAQLRQLLSLAGIGVRTFVGLFQALATLDTTPGGQRDKALTDLFSLSNGLPKWCSQQTPNLGLMGVLFLAANNAPTTAQKMGMLLLYCQDNPNYLIAPAFDPTINITGTTF